MATVDRKPVVAVAFYSTYGHVAQLAESVIKGVEAAGVTVKPYCIKETLTEEILSKMHGGSSLNPKYPVLKPDDLREVDGVLFGAPTRYGRAPAQLSAFFDQCGGLWATGALVGKFAGFFTSAAGQHGGHETTALTTIPFFAHMGMCYVPQGFVNSYTSQLDEIAGGSAWGASTVAASDGSRQPHAGELTLAEAQGKSFAEFVGTFVRGKQRAAAGASSNTATAAAPAATTTGTAAETPVLAKAIPVEDTQKAGGYVVPADGAVADAPAPAATAEPTPAAPAGTTAAATPAPAATPAATEPVATAPATPAAAPAQPKKKGGLFASCCGGRGIEN